MAQVRARQQGRSSGVGVQVLWHPHTTNCKYGQTRWDGSQQEGHREVPRCAAACPARRRPAAAAHTHRDLAARDHAQQRGLALAVGSHQAVAASQGGEPGRRGGTRVRRGMRPVSVHGTTQTHTPSVLRGGAQCTGHEAAGMRVIDPPSVAATHRRPAAMVTVVFSRSTLPFTRIVMLCTCTDKRGGSRHRWPCCVRPPRCPRRPAAPALQRPPPPPPRAPPTAHPP